MPIALGAIAIEVALGAFYASIGVVPGYLLTAQKMALVEARDKYKERFPGEWDIINTKSSELSPEQFTAKQLALKEWNAFAHAYVSSELTNRGIAGGLTEEAAADFTKALGTARENATELNDRLRGDWNESLEKDRNKDEWNNNLGTTLYGMTDEAKAEYLKQQILDHRETPNSSDLIIDYDTDTRVLSNENRVEIDPYIINDFVEDISVNLFDFGDNVGKDDQSLYGKPGDGDDDASDIDNPIIESIKNLILLAITKPSPLILDLTNNGIELASLASGDAVYFDLNNDGFLEAVGWTQNEDGFLVLDINGDGIINNGGELFGDQTGYSNGFLALSAYDSNGDGFITDEDQLWDSLKVWVDSNQNGYSEEDELYFLNDLTITSITLDYDEVNYSIAENTIYQESVFTIGGNQHVIADVYFSSNAMNSVYGGDYIVDYRVFDLADLHGYGSLPALHISMSLNNTGAGNLFDLVEGFSAMTAVDIFAADNAAMDAVRAVMFRWANVDDVNPTSRGDYVDAQELGFLEAMTGQPFLQQGYRPDPLWQAGDDLTEAFKLAHNHFFATLTAQTAAGELFTGDFYYNISTDSIVGITGLNTDVLDALEATAYGLANTADRALLWSNVVRVIEYAVGVDELETGDLIALGNAINGSDPSLNTGDIMELIVGEPVLNAIDGTSGAETLTGTGGEDHIRAYGGDDIIDAGAGNDEVYAGHGSDTITGGAGSDYLSGDYNGDTYIYNPGDGVDIIDDAGGTTGDVILFGAGFDSGDVTLTRVGRYDLEIFIDNGVDVGQIIIADQFGPYGAIETIAFDDTTAIDLATYAHAQYGTAANDNDKYVTSRMRCRGGV